jgi:hypothetical protein
MVRQFVAALAAAVLLAILAAPTDASAKSRGGWSGSRSGHISHSAAFRGNSGFRVARSHFRVAPVRFAYRTRYAAYDSCVVPRRVLTPWGWARQWVNVCNTGYGYYGYY